MAPLINYIPQPVRTAAHYLVDNPISTAVYNAADTFIKRARSFAIEQIQKELELMFDKVKYPEVSGPLVYGVVYQLKAGEEVVFGRGPSPINTREPRTGMDNLEEIVDDPNQTT